MLEQIGERIGAPHHLLAGAYLEKRDGHHGDWVARMEGSRPAKTMVSHMGKDTYGYVHPWEPRTISVREAARVQTFPDWFVFGGVALTDAFRMIGNAVPPLLSHEIARNVAMVLAACCREQPSHATARARPSRLP
jgi:site-specific DNA-cytosine methylase